MFGRMMLPLRPSRSTRESFSTDYDLQSRAMPGVLVRPGRIAEESEGPLVPKTEGSVSTCETASSHEPTATVDQLTTFNGRGLNGCLSRNLPFASRNLPVEDVPRFEA